MSDEVAIRQLVEDYGFAVDSADRGRLAELYTQNCTFHRPNGEEIDGRAKVVEFTISTIERFVVTKHVVGNHSAVVDGQSATGLTYCTAHHLVRRDGILIDHMLEVTYRDTYANDGMRWRFRSRAVSCDWAEERTVASAEVGDMSSFAAALR